MQQTEWTAGWLEGKREKLGWQAQKNEIKITRKTKETMEKVVILTLQHPALFFRVPSLHG